MMVDCVYMILVKWLASGCCLTIVITERRRVDVNSDAEFLWCFINIFISNCPSNTLDNSFPLAPCYLRDHDREYTAYRLPPTLSHRRPGIVSREFVSAAPSSAAMNEISRSRSLHLLHVLLLLFAGYSTN